MIKLLLIAGGGAAGSVVRYCFQQALNANFPAGTFLANILGCFLIGAFWAIFLKNQNEPLQLLLMTGFCGGFTTFSAFSVENIQLLTANRWVAFCLYFTGSIAGGLAATFLGFKIFRS